MTPAVLGLFLVGAAAVDVSPQFCRVTNDKSIIEYQNGCFNWIATTIHDPIWARSLAIQGSCDARNSGISPG